MLPVKVVLILDKRREQAVKYKKNLEGAGLSATIESDFANALNSINKLEPDLILISDSITDSLPVKVIEQIRILTCNTRPVIVVLSKSNHIQDKIEILDSGADDFLSEPMAQEEFLARVHAHLRRNFEDNLSEVTKLFGQKVTLKMLKRTLNSEKPWAALLIDVHNLDTYRELYGELAGEKILQTYAAIINASIEKDDFVGEMENENFLLLTSPYKAEKIAAYLIYAFDTVISKFYNEQDAKRGFVFLQNEDEAENKVSLVSTKIGVISSEYRHFSNVKQVLTTLLSTQKLAKYKEGSNFIADRPQISAEGSIEEREYNKKLMIIEPDEAMSFLLSTAANIYGYETMVLREYTSVFMALKEFQPAVIIIDSGEEKEEIALECCKKVKSDFELLRTNIIFTSSEHDKERILSAGADLYLPKPYEIASIFAWVAKFTNEYNG
ncbi:diguanylate cyclase [bacterium]|nr:diguanylate cyclase [bacterium]